MFCIIRRQRAFSREKLLLLSEFIIAWTEREKDDGSEEEILVCGEKGRRAGLYTEWEECRKQVAGFPGAEFKGFYSREEAEAYLQGENEKTGTEAESGCVVYVDGSYAPFLPDRYAFGAVFLYEEKKRPPGG